MASIKAGQSGKVNPRTQRVREALMKAAFELASKHPVSEISVTEVAELAGVSRPAFYKQFNDVPALVAATALGFMESIFDEITETIPVGDDRAYLQELMERFVQRVYEERDFSRHAMQGPSSAAITKSVSKLLSEQMSNALVGTRLRKKSVKSQKGTPELSSDIMAEDGFTVISAGVIWLLTVWLGSDFRGENAPEAMGERFAAVLDMLSS